LVGSTEIVLFNVFISNAGVSRSASIVIAYLMKNRNLTFDSAYKFVKEKRTKIQPNPGFIAQLRAYESNLITRES
jgi:protein-tyrosine phosphatase